VCVECALHLAGSGWDIMGEGSCEYGNTLPGSTKDRNFLTSWVIMNFSKHQNFVSQNMVCVHLSMIFG